MTDQASRSPKSVFMFPVYSAFDRVASSTAGVLLGDISWDRFLADVLPSTEANGILCLLKDSSGQSHTYELDGGKVRVSSFYY
jgi:hypothetical protein